MVKILNGILCMGCIAGIVAIIATHNRATAADETGANAYFGGGSEWTAVSPATTAGIPGNPFIVGSDDGFTASSLTAGERAQGLKRWNELRELANATPVKVATQPTNPRKRLRGKRIKEAKLAAARAKRQTDNRIRRRTKTLFQQTRHYDQYEATYRNPNNARRRGLPADRRPRSRFR